MCGHKVDEFGYPSDPKLRALEFRLCDLAGTWRASWGDPQRQEEIVQAYHTTMAELYSIGWDGRLDIECELPDRLMPKAYLRRNPDPSLGIWGQWIREKNDDPIKPRIKAFVYGDSFMAIDWNTMRYAFDISTEHGDAGIFVHPPPGSVYPGMGAAISAPKIRRFVLRPDQDTGLTEVVLEVTYGSGEECLGLTDQVEEAEKWVATANELVRLARERKERRSQ
jgi:hypothetical protein